MTTSYTYFMDPGHGWIQVSHAELEVLVITGKITSCSYMDASHAYLEEDVDANTFIEAAGRKSVDFSFAESDEPCFVRKLQPFDAELSLASTGSIA